MTDAAFPTSGAFGNLSKFVYGTTRLGDESLPEAARVQMALRAMKAGVWFHASEQYGDALRILSKAFEQDRTCVPKVIVKLGNESITEVRSTLERNIEPLGISGVDMGQLCLSGALAEDIARGGDSYAQLRLLQAEGLIGHYLLEVFPWTSSVALRAIEAGHADGLIDGCIFYFNPLQRFVSNELWELLERRQVPVVAMRTVAGGDVHRLRDVPGAAWKPYLQKRAQEVAPIFESSGIDRWSEFCLRFAHSFPLVRASVGSTARAESLAEFLDASRGDITPLPSAVTAEIGALQRRWSDEVDMHAEPWTM